MRPRKYATKTRGKPFQAGNPGKPKGARHRTTLAIETLLEGEAEALTRKVIEKAKEGDMTAIRLCLDRIAPPRKDRTIAFALPEVTTPADVLKAVGALLAGVAAGELSPSEAAELSKLLDGYRSALTTVDLEERIAGLEGLQKRRRLIMTHLAPGD
jgi:hypothetical protein